ncbi:hypothetical protein [Azospirillum rugosum]|uniref:Uncharacterized protein n=1 Tax=Azospirillum rugosum TaxID=416170 RepID=A0ABS4SER1_9PROT|nr:hypothetical protein [Azospirillum rugosum]MBP2291056.1 hypothetical protein [Azospirillum rugosum]MDQ0524880.1 hypothetical protein [Azospirillum rugosum]
MTTTPTGAALPLAMTREQITASLRTVVGSAGDFRPGDIVKVDRPGHLLHGDIREVAGWHHSGLLVFVRPKGMKEHPVSLYFTPRSLRRVVARL